MKKYFALPIVLVIAGLALSACGPAAQAVWNPLPPPVGATHPLTYQFIGLGKQSQLQRLISPEIQVTYGETGQGIGGVASETATLLPDNTSAVSQDTAWGDWENGQITRTDYFGTNAQLVAGQVMLTVPEASILHIFTGNIQYVINRSRLALVYVVPPEGGLPVLRYAVYLEEWGATKSDVVAMGAAARWNNPSLILSPKYQQWGFWESADSPFAQVTQALGEAERSLSARPADLLLQDEDSARELIGRQTGFHVYQNGTPLGTIDMEYSNLFGRQPNTPAIGSGALSEVDWNLTSGTYKLLVLSALMQAPDMPASTLYIFVNGQADVPSLKNTQWTKLYAGLRDGSVPGVITAVYATGDLSTVTASGGTSGGDTTTVDVGTSGGIYYTVVGNPPVEHIQQARRLLSLLGQGGLKALGMYYPYLPGSGSGLNYYLATVQLTMLPRDEVFNSFGNDVGILDRVGHLEMP